MIQMADPYGDRFQFIGSDHLGNLYIAKNRQEILVKSKDENEFKPFDKNLSQGSQQVFSPTGKKPFLPGKKTLKKPFNSTTEVPPVMEFRLNRPTMALTGINRLTI